MKTKLSEYIEIARNTEFQKQLFSNEEIRNLSENKSKINSQIKLQTFKGKIIMNSIITLILGLSVAWYSGIMDSNQPDVKQQEAVKTAVKNDNVIASIVSSKKGDEAIEIKKEFNSIPIIKLTDKELEQLGIIKIEGGYKVPYQSRMRIQIGLQKEDKIKELLSNGYDTSNQEFIFRYYQIPGSHIKPEIIKYSGFDKLKPSGAFPLFTISVNDDFHARSSINYGTSLIFESDKTDNIVYESTNKYLKDLLEEKGSIFIKELDFLPIDKKKHPIPRKLVPVYIYCEANEENTANTTLWYLPTEEFHSKLPERYKNVVNSYYDISEKFKVPENYQLPDEKKPIRDKYLSMIKNRIANIPSIELSWDELENLGIKKEKNTGLDFIKDDIFLRYRTKTLLELTPKIKPLVFKFGIDTNLSKILISANLYISSSHIGSDQKDNSIDWSPDTTDYSKSDPVSITLITDIYENGRWDKNRVRLSTTIIPDKYKDNLNYDIAELLFETHQNYLDNPDFSKSKEWLSIASVLIPVHVNLGNKNEIDGNKFSDIMFWFFPNEEFLNKLPKNYADRIRTELGIILDVQSGKTTFEEACKGFKDESLFNICQLKSGALSNLKVFPNPSKGKEININFLLTEKRNVTISIHDLQGNLVQTISPQGQYNTGEVKVKTSGRELSQGLYQIVIYSDKDEMLTTKLIVE
ncbi:MAG: T9SS type A sorting domain-containing protein [bacterium]